MTAYRDAATLQQLLDEHAWNLRATARTLGVEASTIMKWRDRHNLKPGEAAKAAEPDAPPLVEVTSREIRLSGDALILSDLHVPLTRYDLLEQAIDDAVQWDVKLCVIAGDFFNWDTLSDHEPKQSGAGGMVELEHAQYAMRRLLESFDQVVLTLGNHDERVVKRLQYKVRFDKAMRMCFEGIPDHLMAKLDVTDRDYVLIDTAEGVWRACHTRTYSRDPLKFPGRLALRFNQHVAGAHRHHHALGYAANGRWVVELGGLFDATRTEYLTRYSNDFPQWANGWLLLVDGVPHCPMLSRARARV